MLLVNVEVGWKVADADAEADAGADALREPVSVVVAVRVTLGLCVCVCGRAWSCDCVGVALGWVRVGPEVERVRRLEGLAVEQVVLAEREAEPFVPVAELG